MQLLKFPLLIGLLLSGLILLSGSGCAVDNEFIASLPLFEAKSDRIPGLMPPWERAKLIREKGRKGTKASDAEKEVLVAQLMVEYRTSPDPNMRRAAVDAMAKIPHENRDEYMKEILRDENPFVRISALEAIGASYNGPSQELVSIFTARLKADPDKDVRIASIRLLGNSFAWRESGMLAQKGKPVSEDQRRLAVDALGNSLYDKLPIIRYESMQALHHVTTKDYGSDINRWTQYVRHVKGEDAEIPKERTFAEKLPPIHLPMLK